MLSLGRVIFKAGEIWWIRDRRTLTSSHCAVITDGKIFETGSVGLGETSSAEALPHVSVVQRWEMLHTHHNFFQGENCCCRIQQYLPGLVNTLCLPSGHVNTLRLARGLLIYSEQNHVYNINFLSVTFCDNFSSFCHGCWACSCLSRSYDWDLFTQGDLCTQGKNVFTLKPAW